MLNPRPRSAHEHLGEASLVLGDSDKAQQHLAALENICLIPCEEYDDLKRAIAAYQRLAKRGDRLGRRKAFPAGSDSRTDTRSRST